MREDRKGVHALFESFAEDPSRLAGRVKKALERPESFGERIATDPTPKRER